MFATLDRRLSGLLIRAHRSIRGPRGAFRIRLPSPLNGRATRLGPEIPSRRRNCKRLQEYKFRRLFPYDMKSYYFSLH